MNKSIYIIPNPITDEFLRTHPIIIFVYGDNTIHKGTAGAAAFRYLSNTYGFVSKKLPDNDDASFFKPEEYWPVYQEQIILLRTYITWHSNQLFLVSAIGSGLANRYHIWERIILPNIKRDLLEFNSQIQYLF